MEPLLGACFLLLPAAPLLAAQELFPTGKSVSIKEDDKHWIVDERATIANSVSVVSLRSARIEGRSKEKENVILVSGALEFKAVTGGRVIFDNVWIELAPDAKSLYLSQCEFHGGGVRSSDKASTSAKVFMEFTDFQGSASFGLTMKAGSVDLQASSSVTPVIFKGLPLSEKQPNRSNVSILGCSGADRALFAGLEVTGISNVQVRHTQLGGALTRFVDCPKLDFDGNNVRSPKLQFVQSVYGSFGATKVHNCDFRTSSIEFRTPAPEKKLEQLNLDHCWFKGITEAETITDTMVVDHANDPTTGVTITYGRISAAPLGLGGG